MSGELEFGFDFGPKPTQPPKEPGQPFRIVVLGDFSGRSNRPEASPPLQAIRIDTDNFDTLFGRLMPKIDVAVSGETMPISFDSIEDFHPDALFRRLEVFAQLRDLKQRLNDPATSAAAAAELVGTPDDSGDESAADNPSDDSASDFERILGSRPEARSADGKPTARDSSVRGAVDALVRQALAPHEQPASMPPAELVETVDKSIGELLRRVLHAPTFQRLEANWGALSQACGELELDDQLQLVVVDISQAELEACCSATGAVDSPLGRLLTEETPHPSVICAQFAFGESARDLGCLAVLGALSASVQASLIAAASPKLFGIDGFREGTRLRDVANPDPQVAATWSAVRQSGVAPWIALVGPRILGRLPYSSTHAPIDSFAFDELDNTPTHEQFLWSFAPLAIAEGLGHAFTEAEWSLRPSALQSLTGLPVHAYKNPNLESVMQACGEVFLTDADQELLLDAGWSVVGSVRNSDTVHLRVQSIAGSALHGPWGQ